MLEELKKMSGKIDWGKTAIVAMIMISSVIVFGELQENRRHSDQLYSALQDTVRVYQDRYGKQVSEIAQIRTEKPQVFLNIKSNDEEVRRLQAEVAKYKNQLSSGGSVTNFSSSTHIETALDAKGEATDGKWYKIRATSGQANIDVLNRYTVAVVEEHGKALVKVTNDNPFSRQDTVRTYAPLPKITKRWGIGPYAGVDATGKFSAGAAVSWHLFEW